jgi:hypothetical protein
LVAEKGLGCIVVPVTMKNKRKYRSNEIRTMLMAGLVHGLKKGGVPDLLQKKKAH